MNIIQLTLIEDEKQVHVNMDQVTMIEEIEDPETKLLNIRLHFAKDYYIDILDVLSELWVKIRSC